MIEIPKQAHGAPWEELMVQIFRRFTGVVDDLLGPLKEPES